MQIVVIVAGLGMAQHTLHWTLVNMVREQGFNACCKHDCSELNENHSHPFGPKNA